MTFYKEASDKAQALEKQYLQLFQECFNEPTLKTTSKFSIYDYVGDSICIELKQRQIRHNQYRDTMIGMNKINEALKINKKVYFVFLFTDGLYKYQFDKDDLENGNIEMRIGGRNDRNSNEIKDYYYISTNLLSEMV